ncbi:MAG TPA: ankyrin repeat domain-containing protein [Haliangiales bacterium]|nr:ankyrin repeat domain-containing protein [Haliangiales bacterium]
MPRELALGLAVAALAACSPPAQVPPGTGARGPNDLVAAVTRGDATEARALLDRGADPNARDANGNSALVLAVLYADARMVGLLLERKADPNLANAGGATALHWAVDDPAETAALLAAGADPNAVAASGLTPLMAAAARDDSGAVVPLLLERGADPNRGGGGTWAVILAGGGDPVSLAALVDRGADPRAATPGGYTALHAAAKANATANARLLLARGADPNARDGHGRTPLMWAAQMGSDDIVALLLARGADANVGESFSGTTALMQAAASDRADEAIVRALLAAGANVRLVDDEGLSALAWASRRGDASIVGAIKAVDRAHREPPAAPPPSPSDDRVGAANTVKRAVARAIPLLERAGPAFRAKSGCPSCHNGSLPAMALARAAGAGFAVDDAARRYEARVTVDSLRSLRERLLQGVGFADVLEPAYFLVGLDAAGYPRDDMTDAMARYLALRQTRDGSWRTQMQRIPIDGSDVSFTALAVRSLRAYAPPSRPADTDARVARARVYLARMDARTNEDLAYQALGLRWAGGGKTDVAPILAKLVARQRPDGGFAQRDSLASDAYATGQAIVALRDAGEVPADDPVVRRAAAFLLADQRADGSWFVATRALPFQPFFDSGLPHGRSQYMSAAATSWAVLALASVGD